MPNDSSTDVLTRASNLIASEAATLQKTPVRWAVPAGTTIVLLGLFCLYYFVYVGARREYLINRNFRMLAALGDQIQTMITTHGSVLEFYADEAARKRHRAHGRTRQDIEKFLVPHEEDKHLSPAEQQEEEKRDYFHYLAPNFELATPAKATAASANPPQLHVERRDGQWLLVLTAQEEKEDKTDFVGSLKLDDLLKPLIGSLPFDDILLASADGTIVYEDKKAGPQFSRLDDLLENQIPPDKKPASGSATSRLPIHLTEIRLTDTRYKVFLQPLLVDVFTDDPNMKKAPPQYWALCGLRTSSALEWEALAISYSVIIWVAAAFSLALIGAPVLKLIFMNGRERFHLRELALTPMFLALLSGVLTLVFLQWAYFDRNDAETERQLEQLADTLSQNIYYELHSMQAQLVTFCQGVGSDLMRAGKENTDVIRKRPSEGRTDLKTDTPFGTDYPYFANAFWTDDDGHQVVKWSGGEYVTPMIDISDTAIFKQPKSTYLDGAWPPFHFDSIQPPNKLEYMAALAMKTCDCNPELCNRKKSQISEIISRGSAFLVAQPFSLIDPVLPFGYGFALVDQAGTVLFHVDKTRNRHENIRQESDWNKELYAAAFGHGTQHSLAIAYRGQAYRAVVMPVARVSPAPWMLVVYRDLTVTRTLDLQAITMTSTLMLLFLAGPVVVCALWWRVRRPRFAPEWLWPNPARRSAYQSLAAIYLLLAIVFLLWGFRPSSEVSALACAALPWAVLLLTVWCFRFHAPHVKNTTPGRFVLAQLPLWLMAVVALTAWLRHGTPSGRLAMAAGLGGIAMGRLLERPRQYLVRRFRYRYVDGTAEPSRGRREWSLNYRTGYAANCLLVIILLGVLMPLALFRASLSVERRLRIKQAQLHLASNLDQHQLRAQEQKEAGDNSSDWLAVWDESGLMPPFTLDGIPEVGPYSSWKATEIYNGWFQRLVYMLHHDYNEASAEMLGVIADRTRTTPARGDPDWAWSEAPEMITLHWHGIHPSSAEAAAREQDLTIRTRVPGFSGRDTGIAVAICGAVMLLMGALFRVLARRLFLFDVTALKMTGQQQLADALREGRNVLILKPRVSSWQLQEPKWPLEIPNLATRPRWAEQLDLAKLPATTLVEIRDFEHTTNDPDLDNQKGVLLQRLLSREKTQVAVVMTVDASAEDYRREFPDLAVIDLREEPFLWLQACEGPARDLIWNEVRPLSALWPIGAQVAKDVRNDLVLSPETVASEILERADPYYRLVWDECSNEQKFVLAQLAQDGLANPKNVRTLRQMIRRGLIVKDPQFRIMNESFRRFLCGAVTADLQQGWLRDSQHSGWGKARGAFVTTLIVVGIFLLTTQNELWQSSAAYVTTALGALGTLSKLFNTVRGTAPEQKSS